MTVRGFRDLIVWRKAMDFVVSVYQETTQFPKDEMYGLTQQLRRACVSIPSNIAEGHGRHSTKDYLHFLSIAYGSLNEAQTQILLAERLAYLPKENSFALLELASEIAKLINALCNSLTAKCQT